MAETPTLSLLRRIASAVGKRLDTGGIQAPASAMVEHIRPAELAGLVATLVAEYENERRSTLRRLPPKSAGGR